VIVATFFYFSLKKNVDTTELKNGCNGSNNGNNNNCNNSSNSNDVKNTKLFQSRLVHIPITFFHIKIFKMVSMLYNFFLRH
jgi:hypothetical protein